MRELKLKKGDVYFFGFNWSKKEWWKRRVEREGKPGYGEKNRKENYKNKKVEKVEKIRFTNPRQSLRESIKTWRALFLFRNMCRVEKYPICLQLLEGASVLFFLKQFPCNKLFGRILYNWGKHKSMWYPNRQHCTLGCVSSVPQQYSFHWRYWLWWWWYSFAYQNSSIQTIVYLWKRVTIHQRMTGFVLLGFPWGLVHLHPITNRKLLDVHYLFSAV